MAECESIEQVFDRLEEQQLILRLDPSILPSMIKGATVSLGELDRLRSIGTVVRLGHVTRIDTESITLEGGSAPTSPDHLHVHCASAGLSDNPPRPIFTDDTILLQPITRVSLSLSAGLIGLVEASGRSTAEKNRLCPPNVWFDTPFDWIRHLLSGMRTELEWREAPDVLAWVESSRLNLMKGLDQSSDKAAVARPAEQIPDRTVPCPGRFRDVDGERHACRARADVRKWPGVSGAIDPTLAIWAWLRSGPGRNGSIDLFARRRALLVTPAQSDAGLPGVTCDPTHMGVGDVTNCSCPPVGYETGSRERPPASLHAESPT